MSHQIRTRIAVAVTGTALAVPLALALAAPAQAATSTQTASMLTAMVTEEKLAHDVYTTLGAQYPSLTQFDRIARSETQHMSALRALLQTYGVTDPTLGDGVGVFDDASVQALYDRLVAQGKTSVAQAAQAGIAVEKLDIADLEEALAADYSADIDRVLSRLRSGSQRHLSAFTAMANGDTQATTGGMGRHGHGRGMR